MTFSPRYDRLIRVKLFKALILSLGLSSVASATITINSISGVSDAVQATATDNTTVTWTVTGGISGPVASAVVGCSANGGHCNTCRGLAIDGACNPAAVFADTVVTFSATTTVSGGLNKLLLCNGTTEIANSVSNMQTLTTTWGTICAGIVAGNGTCSQPVIGASSVYFGAGVDCPTLAAAEKVSVKFLAHFVDPTAATSVYTDCPDITSPPGGYGACHFKLFPGDEKVYLESADFIVDSTWPTVGSGVSTEIKFNNVYFFFVEKFASETDGDAVARITNDSASSISTSFIPVSDDETLGGSYIDGLSNDSEYCFRMASQDNTKHIQYFTPLTLCPAGADNTPDCNNICMMPSEVVGILTDKKCFIATAAYGSDMDQHVQMLRKFRNEYMAPFWIGRKLIKTYYKLSPPFARWISDKKNMKAIARGALWPVMGWAELALKFGWSVIIAPFLFIGLGLVVLRKRQLGFKKA